MINEVITEYLKTNKRLVVPGFGAFIRKDDGGEVVFVEFLKKDDGVLTSLLAGRYGLSATEASAAVAEYVDQVRRHAATGARFVIGGLGSLRADANGLYGFDYDPSANETAPQPKAVSQPVPVTAKPAEPVPGAFRREPVAEPVRPARPSVQECGPSASVRPDAPASSRVPAGENPRTSASGVNRGEAHPSPRREDTPVRDAVRNPAGETTADSSQTGDTMKKYMHSFSVTGREKTAPEEGVGQDEVRGLRYQKPRRPAVPGQGGKRTDMIMVIAVIAALMAIAAMMYSIFADNNKGGNLLEKETVEVVVDSTAVEN